MDELLSTIDKLLSNKNEDPKNFYSILSNYTVQSNHVKYLNDIIIPKVHYLYEQHILRKDLVYFTLLASENTVLLETFIEFDKLNFKLHIKDPVSLYDFYIYFKEHWLYQIINNNAATDSEFSKNIYTKIQLLNFVQTTNLHLPAQLHISEINALLTQIDTDYLDEFWKYYLREIDRLIDITNFCANKEKQSEIFEFASKHSLLTTLSNYVNLIDGNNERWESVLKKIEQFGDADQTNLFTGFIIIGNILNIIIKQTYIGDKKDCINTLIETINIRLIQLQSKQLQIELLENIFSLIFNRSFNDFTCKEKEIRLILFLLKLVIDEIKLKKLCKKESPEYARLTALNIHLTDALWRLDLISAVKNSPKIEDQLINYMLAPPESLIKLCLKRNNFQRAYQVIEIFNLRESDVAREINYTELFQKFRKVMRKLPKENVIKSIQEFFAKNPPPRNRKHDEIVEKFSEKLIIADFPQVIEQNNETFIDLFDLTITYSTKDDCEQLLQLIEEQNSSSETCFYSKILNLSRKVYAKDGKTPPEILISPQYPLDCREYSKKEEFYENLQTLYDEFHLEIGNFGPGVLNKSHPCHKILLKLNELCTNFVTDVKEQPLYLQKVYNYLHAFSKILYIEENSSDIISRGRNSSFFELFNFNRSELTGILLFERHLDPTEFEKYFGKLKLDFLYHVVGNCFPTINLHVQEHVTLEELYHDNMLYTPSQAIIIYIQKRNWLLAFLLNEMYKIEGVKMDLSEIRLKQFFHYMKLPRIQNLKPVFEHNEILTALQNCISAQKVKIYFEENIVKQDLLSIGSQNSNNSSEELTEDVCEQAEEILEDAKTTNWKALWDVAESIPEEQQKKKFDFIRSKNTVIVNLVQDCFEPEFYKYARFIVGRDLRIDTILSNLKKWPGEFAINLIKSEITRFDAVDDEKMEILRKWSQKIDLHEKLKIVLGLKSWYKSYELCKKDPARAIQQILQLNELDILLDFIQLYKLNDDILTNIESNYVTKIMELNTPFAKVKKLLDNLPFNHAINICNNLLTILRNLIDLQCIANYLNDNIPGDIFLKNVQVSLKMLSIFTAPEQDQLFCLISEPLSILEVLVMNTKLDKLALVLEALNLQNSNYDESIISVEKIDQLLRKYAEKSLDFRVITQPNPKLFKPQEHKLLQSLDSLNLSSESRQFSVPDLVPEKHEWTKNEEVIECMCCRLITFSMFNRRHHCRRCGRVICYNCSQKRMLVPSYGDILVRVCLDCYEQTIGKSGSSDRSDAPSSRSFSQEFWLLNDDPEHNKIIYEEFSYEHAPSISLCLSILKYHSKSHECPKFLLEQCEVMLKLLLPNQETHEIDYLLVIKMLKSLAMAAKLMSSEHMLSSGSSLADRIISQAELLALLAEKGCLNLMSGSSACYVDTSVLRRLRDKLLQREQWKLALEVSTKAGLDNTGVFTAWGKSCLKAGSLHLAREKFQRCLEKTTQYENLSNTSRLSEAHRSIDSLNIPSRSRYSSRVSGLSSTSDRPLKNPPLLNEIIQILETKTRTINPTILTESNFIKLSDSVTSLNQLSTFTVQRDTALSIRNRLKNLGETASGNYRLTSSKKTSINIDPIFYEECVYYLCKYGTHQSLLEFYVKHGDIEKALVYIIENRLSSEIFVEIYMKCLRDGVINSFQENMSKIDSSLDLWKDHLRQICRHLEKQNLLNCLYQLQLYIGDYVRAAMTCIRFYQDNVKKFTELLNNVCYLHRAEEHLKQVLEQEQWVEVTSVGKVSTDSKNSFEEKMLANPDLVMKIDNKDIDKHIKTFERQIEVVEFLAKCESKGTNTGNLIKQLELQRESKAVENKTIPTLFGTTFDKIILAVMVMISGENNNVDENGFALAIKIIQDFKLRPIRVYCVAGKQLAKMENYKGISQLVNCIKSAGTNDAAISDMLDEMLTQAVGTLIKADITGTKVEDLIRLIKDRAMKISAYIEAKQLKTAYFLAVKYKRTADIRRIQSEAELLNMPTIKALCQKVLQSSQTIPSSTKE